MTLVYALNAVRILSVVAFVTTITTAGAARACMPLEAPPATPMGAADIAFVTGLSEISTTAGSSACALRDFQLAVVGYHDQSQRERSRAVRDVANGYIVASLSYAGVANDRMGRHKESVRDWTAAAQMYAKLGVGSAFFADGDGLFSHHNFRAAFASYRALLFPTGAKTRLNPVEVESGAARSIRDGLDLAVQGRFQSALDRFASSPQSEVASYLEGQAAQSIGNLPRAHKAYIAALFPSTPTTGSNNWIGGVEYSALLQLLRTANLHPSR
jgi:hypothetical protein